MCLYIMLAMFTRFLLMHAAEFEHIGDMVVYRPYYDNQDQRERRNAVIHPNALWPQGIVPYEISSVFSSKMFYLKFSYTVHGYVE